jgi:hypothetical protein
MICLIFKIPQTYQISQNIIFKAFLDELKIKLGNSIQTFCDKNYLKVDIYLK